MRTPRVYADNNATTQVAPEVLTAMLPFLQEAYANPSSAYACAEDVQDALLLAHEQVATLLGAKPGEIIMTSCGTESTVTAFHSACAMQAEKRHLILSAVEHPATLALAETLRAQGYAISLLGVDRQGRIAPSTLATALRDDTALVSILFANNETGTISPVAELGALCRERGVLFHTDAVQAAGKVPINLAELPVDYLSLSGHKLHAPKGIGALFVRTASPFVPLLPGGHQEYGRRAGTQAVPAIVALGEACKLAVERMEADNAIMKQLRDTLQERLLAAIPATIVNGDQSCRLPNTLNLSFRDVTSAAILEALDQAGICASAGSACTAYSSEPSHVLRAMRLDEAYIRGTLRLSLSGYSTLADIDAICEHLPVIIDRLRA